MHCYTFKFERKYKQGYFELVSTKSQSFKLRLRIWAVIVFWDFLKGLGQFLNREWFGGSFDEEFKRK